MVRAKIYLVFPVYEIYSEFHDKMSLQQTFWAAAMSLPQSSGKKDLLFL